MSGQSTGDHMALYFRITPLRSIPRNEWNEAIQASEKGNKTEIMKGC